MKEIVHILTSGIRKMVISYGRADVNELSRNGGEKTGVGRGEQTDLLLEVPPVLLVDEDEVEIISRAKLLVHVAECRREVEAAEEEPYWDRLAWR